MTIALDLRRSKMSAIVFEMLLKTIIAIAGHVADHGNNLLWRLLVNDRLPEEKSAA